MAIKSTATAVWVDFGTTNSVLASVNFENRTLTLRFAR